ncbi:tetratricopeptide repeat protein [Ferrimonas kyonanensis]|uniref:tetratricopeptide repeat protein n=1 Tax=Ferrimonas kyonanensis TaxID=364763 RepID=UPI000484A3B7|nr:tetratricopeptide repeat protein [Ferrimonas kyonanensis]
MAVLLVTVPGYAQASTCNAQPSPYINQALTRASLFLEQEKPQQALRVLSTTSEKAADASHHLLEFHLGVQLAQHDQPQQALIHFRHASQLCDSHAGSWQNLGRLAFETGHFDEAATALEQAFRLSGEQRSDLRYFQALARYKQQHWQDSLTLSLELLSRFPAQRKLDWIELAAAAADAADRRPQVIDTLFPLVPAMGGSPRFRRSLASLLVQEQRFSEAMIQLKDLDHMGVIDPSELRILADICRMEELPLDAAGYYHRLAAQEHSAELTEKEAESWIAGFQLQRARVVLEREVAHWDTPRLWLLTGQLRFDDGELEPALTAFRRVLTHTPDHRYALTMTGYILFLQDKLDAALPWLDKAADDRPGNQAGALSDYIKELLEYRQRHQQLTAAPAQSQVRPSTPPSPDNKASTGNGDGHQRHQAHQPLTHGAEDATSMQ